MEAVITLVIAKCAAYAQRFATRVKNLRLETKDLEWRRGRIKIALGKLNRRRAEAQAHYDRHKDKPTKRYSATAALEEAKRAWREKYDELLAINKELWRNARKAENAEKSLATCQRKLESYEREAEAQQKAAKSRARIVALRKEKILRRIQRDKDVRNFVLGLQPSEIADANDACVHELVTLCGRESSDAANRDAAITAILEMHAVSALDSPDVSEEPAMPDLPAELLKIADELGVDLTDPEEREALLLLADEVELRQSV